MNTKITETKYLLHRANHSETADSAIWHKAIKRSDLHRSVRFRTTLRPLICSFAALAFAGTAVAQVGDAKVNLNTGALVAPNASTFRVANGLAIGTHIQAFDPDLTLLAAVTPTMRGDLLAFTGTAWNRLPAGTNGQVLTADNAQGTGVKWAAASSGGSAVHFPGTALIAGASGNDATGIVGDFTRPYATADAALAAGARGFWIAGSNTYTLTATGAHTYYVFGDGRAELNIACAGNNLAIHGNGTLCRLRFSAHAAETVVIHDANVLEFQGKGTDGMNGTNGTDDLFSPGAGGNGASGTQGAALTLIRCTFSNILLHGGQGGSGGNGGSSSLYMGAPGGNGGDGGSSGELMLQWCTGTLGYPTSASSGGSGGSAGASGPDSSPGMNGNNGFGGGGDFPKLHFCTITDPTTPYAYYRAVITADGFVASQN